MATIRITGDEVQIDNIATEATQRSIAEKLGAFTGSSNSLSSNMDNASQSAGAWQAAVDAAKGATIGTAQSLTTFGLAAFDGTARISTATDALRKNFGAAGTAVMGLPDTLVKGAEGYVDTFRQLSGSGASFSADIFEMKNAAAQARISLDSFAGIVAENSQGFAAFGGTVSTGARLFSQASQTMFDEGLSDPLLMMGYTFEEINENLANYMTINRRRFTEEQMRNGEAAAAMVAMSTEMDKIAKLTGKNRQELEKEINDRMRKGQVEAKIRMLEASGNKEAADKMRRALAEAEKAGPGALAAVEDLFTKGAVVSEEGRAAAVALGPAFNDLTNMVAYAQGPGGIEGMTSSINNFNSAVAARIQDPDFLNVATLGGMGNQFADAAAGMVTSAGTYSDNVQRLMDRENLTREQAIARLGELASQEQGGADTPGADITRTIVNSEQAIRDFGAVISDKIIGPEGALTQFIEALNEGEGLRPFADFIGSIDRTSIETTLGDINQQLQDALGLDMPGSDLDETQTQNLSNLDDKLNTLYDSGDQAMKDQIARFKALAASLTAIDPDFAVKLNEAAERTGHPEEYLRGLLTDMPASFEQAITGLRDAGLVDLNNTRQSVNDIANIARDNLERVPEGGPLTGAVSVTTMTVDRLIANSVANNEAGTKATLGGNGIVPNDMLSLIHKGERVLNNAEAQAFSALENGASSAMASVGANSGGTLAEKLDNLNQSMLQLVNINMQAQEIARRQLKGIKGMTSDVMTGFGV
jgi:hypothetical protein